MWKEDLPRNCPPDNAFEMERKVYRFIKNREPQERDFYPYIKLYPNKRLKNICKAYALSFFDTKENAIKARSNAKNDVGNYIAEVQIIRETGRNIYTQKSGHYSTWLYETWNYSNFAIENIERIDED